MSWLDVLKGLLRQCTYALACFCALVLIAEYFAPASVTPFLDPVPLTIIALVLLSADAMRRPVTPNVWVRSILASIALVIAIVLAWMRI